MWLRVLSIGILMVIGCSGSSTTIEQSWRAPQGELEQLRNVVTVYISPDGSIRRSIEDQMAAKLYRKGIRATPLYAVLSEDVMHDKDQATAILRQAGYDGVVAIRLVSKESYSWGTFDDYWGSAWPSVYDPSYAITEIVVRVETNVYSLHTNKLLWSALSRTLDPTSTSTVVDEVTSIVAKELDNRGVVVGTRER